MELAPVVQMLCGRTKWERKTVRQFHQVPTTPLFLDTCHWRTAAVRAQYPYLTALALWVVHCFAFAPARHGHCRILCPQHGLLTECFSKPNVRFASATHACALHAHNKPRLLWKTRKGEVEEGGRRGRGRKGEGREHVRLSTPLQKVPVRSLTFHVMPRQRLYPDDFGQITMSAWSLSGISWNA